jgi:hypothetical protein
MQIHQENVWPQILSGLNCLGKTRSLADEINFRHIIVKESPNHPPQHIGVIREKNRNGHSRHLT